MAAVHHSMVWDQLDDGKFRFGDELMENLFGYSTIKNQSSERKNHLPSASSKPNSCPNTSGFHPRSSKVSEHRDSAKVSRNLSKRNCKCSP
ncbi:hypothetical protein C1H46_025524 [Malus baccata]|uniref:Uncharacterized protein n=1 Tax=Malus baccata TaxID=106549 RepID=A0A540LRP8_MALBA|nr:hypothetical protein C1H46_025524 [Malus baccata]